MNKHILFFATLVTSSLLFITNCASTSKEQKQPVPEKQQEKQISLQELIANGKTQEVKELFTSKYNINAVDKNGDTALHVAARKNDADLVTFLITKGADTNLKNYNSDTPLHVAIKNDSFEAARILSTVSGDIFSRNKDGISALALAINKNDVYYDIMITTKNGELRDTDGETIVHYFVKTKNLKAINYCIKKGIPVDVKDNTGKTPLALALENSSDYDSIQIAATLLKFGVRPISGDYDYFENAVTERSLSMNLKDGQTPLHIAVISGHSGIAEYLIKNGANLSAQDLAGATPLHEAVRYGQTDLVSMLLKNGANPNAKDSLGNTPLLLIPPEKNRKEVYKLLLSSKANPNIKDTFGDTPLHIATLSSMKTDILDEMIQAGADINARNKQGITPLTIAVENKLMDHVNFYISHNADIYAGDNQGNTPLSIALAGNLTMLQALVTKENVDNLDSEGNSPLLIAIENRAPIEKIEYILSLNPNVNIRNSDGNSALNLVVQNHREDIGKELLQHGANIFSTNKDNCSPLRLALEDKTGEKDWLLTSKTIAATDGSGNTALHYAAEWGLESAVQKLLEKGADPNARNANGETPIFSAAENDNTNILSLLAKEGADISIRDHLGSTPLHIAVRWNALNEVPELIKMGISVNTQNISGQTPLSEAVIVGNVEMAELLLQNGANPNSSDTDGKTILSVAIQTQQIPVIKLLLNQGANPQIQDMYGTNAYHEAAKTGNIEIINLIHATGGNPLSRNKKGITPFALSLQKDIKVIDAVLGDKTTITDSDGNTPIHIAVKNNVSADILSHLVEKGYPLDTRNSEGDTPLSITVRNANENLCLILLQNGANPFTAIRKKGSNALTIAFAENNTTILGYMGQYAGTKTDVQGNTILHYAAKTASAETITKLLQLGLKTTVKNLAGATPYDVAVNWERKDIAELFKNNSKE